MIELNLKINNVIDVLYGKEMYRTNIQDIKKDEILITIPVNDGIYLTLNIEDEIEQFYYDDNGNVFLYKSRVIGRYKEGNISFYKISKPYDIKKIQRRNYVRVNLIQVIKYLKKDSTYNSNTINEPFKEGLLLDLSGGGMKIKVKDGLSINDEIKANLTYENEKLNIKGKVVRVDRTEDNKIICGIRFEDINNVSREKIIRIVFKIMRKQRMMI